MAAVPSIGRASRVEHRVAPAVDEATQLYERYSVQIFGYCLHQLGSREEAEDAVQTTFMNAFRGLARGIVPDVEQAWLFKIAHNVCLSRRRSSWRRGRVEAPNNMEVLQEVVPAKEKVADELIRLQDVLEEMPESQRRAILLREWQGLSYREIADELELSQAAVETLIFRARRALAAGLEEAAAADGTWRRRVRRGADVGGVLAFVKTLLGGGGAAAVKVAGALALAGAAIATTAADELRPQQHQASAPVHASSSAATMAPAETPAVASAPAASDRPTTSRRAKASRVIAPARSDVAPTPKVTAPAPQQDAPAPSEQTTSATASPSVQTADPAPAKPSPPKQSGSHGKHLGHPSTPPPAAAGSGKASPGKGHVKDQPAAEQPEPQAEAPAAPPASDATAPGNSGQAPGQQDKPENANKGGNGRGK